MIRKPSPNFTVGRGGRKVDLIVIHVMEGTLEGTDSWFASPASKVSAHYGIGANGEEHQYVDEENQAWHAGRVLNPTAKLVLARPGVNPNSYSIGIEHEGTATSVWPSAMVLASALRVRDIATRHGFPIDRDHVVGHREIYSGKTCPGAGDVDRIVRLAQTPVPQARTPLAQAIVRERWLRRGDISEEELVRACKVLLDVTKNLDPREHEVVLMRETLADVRDFYS